MPRPKSTFMKSLPANCCARSKSTPLRSPRKPAKVGKAPPHQGARCRQEAVSQEAKQEVAFQEARAPFRQAAPCNQGPLRQGALRQVVCNQEALFSQGVPFSQWANLV